MFETGLVLPPDGGREPEVAGSFGKARLIENSPLWWLIGLAGVELSGRLVAADETAVLVRLFVFLRRVTLLDKENTRLWPPDAEAFPESGCTSDSTDLFEGILRMLTKGTAAFSCADDTEGFLVTKIWFNFCLSLEIFDNVPLGTFGNCVDCNACLLFSNR